MTFGVWRNIGFKFRIDSLLSKTDYYSYEGVVTFSNSYYCYADDIEKISDIIRYGDHLYYFLTRRAILNVERSRSYEVIEIVPTPNNIGYWDGSMWYRYDLKDRTSPSISSACICLNLEDPQIKYNYEMRKCLTWLFLGAGIPTAITSLAEILKVGGKFTFHRKQLFLTTISAIIALAIILLGISILIPLS